MNVFYYYQIILIEGLLDFLIRFPVQDKAA